MTTDDATGVPAAVRRPPAAEGRSPLRDEWRSLVDEMYEAVPPPLRSGLQQDDARFLFQKFLLSGHPAVLEVTPVPGLVTALIAAALQSAEAAGFVRAPLSVTCVDVSARPRPRHPLAGLLDPPPAVDLRYGPAPQPRPSAAARGHRSDLLVLGVHHRHPCPVLDLLTTVDAAAPGDQIVVYASTWGGDPISASGVECIARGFAGSDVVDAWPETEPARVCGLTVPADPAPLRDRLLGVLYDNPWEIQPEAAAVRAAMGWEVAG